MGHNIHTYNIHVACVHVEKYIKNEAIQSHGIVHPVLKGMEITLASQSILLEQVFKT